VQLNLNHKEPLYSSHKNSHSHVVMVKATKGNAVLKSRQGTNTKTAPGTLVKCDASIKAMLIDIDSKHHDTFIIEDLDEEHVLVKDTMVAELKQRLHGVRCYSNWRGLTSLKHSQMMKERLKEPESSESES
jgi:TFIIH basal transcription factor complex TTD-A subunit